MVSRITTSSILTKTRSIGLVSILERNAITFTNVLTNKKKDENGNANETNFIEDIIVMVSDIYVDMITKVHMAVIANPFDWWFDSGAMVHVCKNKEQFKTFKESSIE